MSINTIDASLLQKMFLAGAQNLEANKEWINELNVFPVPDGDTGTNMTLTILSAAKEVAALENPAMDQLSKAISSGSLRGARGNSGVILSQLLRGFTKEIKECAVIDIYTIANAFQRATETAYKAVMKPKEGTILTVAKGMAEKAAELAGDIDDMEEYLGKIIEHGNYVLSQTPEMLPVLKQAGVVDSGGQGLMVVVQGCYDAYLGKEISGTAIRVEKKPAVTVSVSDSDLDTSDIKFGYCTEFIINLEKEFPIETEMEFKGFLESIGDSIVVVADDEIVKVHVHTNHPGQAFEKALTYGSLSRMKVDNMREEHQEKLIKDAERVAAEQKAAAQKIENKPYGIISVSVGEGLNEIFKELGVDYLIEGGQTMNPSTEDMLNAIDKIHADTIFILPNNKNIILAAEQARDLTEDKKIIVIPSKTIPQGIAAIINFVPDFGPEENEEAMVDGMSNVQSAQITYAVRNTMIDDKEIHEGDIMAIGDKSMLAVGTDINETILDALRQMVDEDSELVSVYYGSDITEEQAAALQEEIENEFDGCDIEVHAGGQPVYYYILSVE